MLQCSNCGAQLTCGCQKKIATDGRSVCANCVNAYNAKIHQQNLTKISTVVPPKQ